MKPVKTVLLFLLFIFYSANIYGQESIEVREGGALLLENFQTDSVGYFPSEWYDQKGNAKLINHDPSVVKNYHYTIAEEGGNKYLRYAGANAKHINYPLVNKDRVNIYETPILMWKARAHQLPQNANEDDKDRNDAVMSVYVVFDFGKVLFKKVPKSIRYSWSSSLPKGTELSKFFSNQKIVIVESGPGKTGEWITFKRNLVEDYRKLFGDDPPAQPIAILILSDGDSTGSYVRCDYDDFWLKPAGDDKTDISNRK